MTNWNKRYAHDEGAREFEDCACGQYPKIRRLVNGLHNAMEDHRNYNTEMTRENVEHHLVDLIQMHRQAISRHDPNYYINRLGPQHSIGWYDADVDSDAIELHKNNIDALRQQREGL